MEKITELPINEAVYFLSKISPAELETFLTEFPYISDELVPGKTCGGDDGTLSFTSAKAKIIIKTLEIASKSVILGIEKASKRVRLVNKIKTTSEILTLVGSSAVLGTITLKELSVPIIAAIITLLASLGSVLIEHVSRLVTPELGNINDAYKALTLLSYQSNKIAEELELAIEYSLPEEKVADLIRKGNEIMNDINKWDVEVLQ